MATKKTVENPEFLYLSLEGIIIQVKHPDKNYDVDEIMSELMVYELRPGD